jgi:uncharacterized membrane protein YdjX (TVP38/TMEM64 family)
MPARLRLIIVVLLAVLIPVVPFVLLGELPGERWLSAADDNALQFALTGAGLLAADALLPVPSSILGTLLGARLGFLAGALSAWLGMLAGNLLAYAGGRLLLGRLRTPLPETPTLTVGASCKTPPGQLLRRTIRLWERFLPRGRSPWLSG